MSFREISIFARWVTEGEMYAYSHSVLVSFKVFGSLTIYLTGFCRPMNAPLLKYSSQLVIPTCIWYLTGYILSLEGIKFLLQSLPCIGPIDSWIGLKMTANWDNVYGQKVGLGVSSKVIVDLLPPRKDLVKILRFRAFAALVPLCSQKLTSSLHDSAKWRDRDTDITYSGR